MSILGHGEFGLCTVYRRYATGTAILSIAEISIRYQAAVTRLPLSWFNRVTGQLVKLMKLSSRSTGSEQKRFKNKV